MKTNKTKSVTGSKEYKNGYSLGNIVAEESVDSQYGCTITIQKIEDKEGSYRLRIGMYQDPNCGGTSGFDIESALKSELIELSQAFARMAEKFPESSY